MCALLDIIASSLDRGRIDPSIGVAGVVFCMGLFLLRVAKTTALVLQEYVYSCVPAVLRPTCGQSSDPPHAISWDQGGL